jgi:transcriptional regulator with XRE-family HTH domain
MITGAQVRAARALLDWTQEQLAAQSHVASRTIHLFESGDRNPYRQTLEQMQSALEAAGIEFLQTAAGQGVLLRMEQNVAETSQVS